MWNLEAYCGFPLTLTGEGELFFSPAHRGMQPAPAVRTLDEMRPFLSDRWATGPARLYWMYRDAALPEHREYCARLNVRYDITVLRSGEVGGEPVKTAGHYHPPMPGSALTYGEVYQVLHGRAICLLQRAAGGAAAASGRVAAGSAEADGAAGIGGAAASADGAGKAALPGDAAADGAAEARPAVDDVIWVDARPGDLVVIPPGYGHVTVNAGKGPLAMANWVDPSFQADYRPYRRAHGAAYYVRLAGDGRNIVFDHNPAYGEPAPLRQAGPDVHLRWREPMYMALLDNPRPFLAWLRPAAETPFEEVASSR